MIRPLLLLTILLSMQITLAGQMPQLQSITPLSAAVEQYGKFEVALELTAAYDNPYDYDQIGITGYFTAPNGDSLTVDGFYMQDLELNTTNGALTPGGSGGHFKLRFSPNQPGQWQYRIEVRDLVGMVSSSQQNFVCVAAGHKGFVRSNQSNYLHFDNGMQYIPVGENMAWQNNNAFVDYNSWLSALSNNGGNFIRLWHAHWGLGIEWENGWNGFAGLRRYKESNMAYQDWLFDFCAARDIYVMLCIQHHGQVSSQVNPNWADSPYNVVNGGPCQNTWDFFTNAVARAHTKNRLRYIVARWGYTRSIMAWELFNEVGWTDNYQQHQAEIANWHAEMAAYLKSIDPYQHLVTTSFADENQDPMVWANPDIDLTQTHYYLNTSNIQKALVNGIGNYLSEFGKPTLTGEFGLGGSSGLANTDPDGIHIHNAMWATLFGGGLGTGMSWWWDSYIHPRNLYYHFAPMSAVAAEIPFLEKDLRPATTYVSGAGGDLVLTPTLGWAGIGTDTIEITANGSLQPANANLGIYLYGSQWNTQFRSPPTFVANYPQAATFTVKTNADSGTNPRIALYVDGVKVLDEAGGTNQTFTVPITAGSHVITVDNTGTDWITIASYTLAGLGSTVDAYVLKAQEDATAAGWVLNKHYNHIEVTNQGQPDPIIGGVLNIEGFANGGYSVFWYDCISGALAASESAFAENGRLQIVIPELYWDLAFWVESNPLGVRKPEPAVAFQVYPNPVTTGGSVQVQIKEQTSDGNTRLALFDAAGKPLAAKQANVPEQKLQLDLPPDLAPGMYWLQVQQQGKLGSRPIVVVE